MKAIAVANFLLLIGISPFISCGAGRKSLKPIGQRSSRPVARRLKSQQLPCRPRGLLKALIQVVLHRAAKRQ
jgi:hypothetical protein